MNSATVDDYLDFKEFVKKHPQFKIGQLRWLVVKKKQNGFDKVVCRLGRKLYIHVPSFIKYISKQKS